METTRARLMTAALAAFVLSATVWSVGCRKGLTEDVAPELATALESCTRLEGESRDACALTALQRVSGVDGPAVGEVCLRLRTQDVRDQCIEHAMTLRPLPEASLCGRIDDERMRDSCQLSVANEVIRTGTIDEAIAACGSTGPLVEHCLAHIAEYRQSRWQQEGAAAMMAELEQVIAEVPGAADSHNFGSSVGVTAHFFGFTAGQPGGPCDLLPVGQDAERLCRDRHLANQTSHPQGGAGRASPLSQGPTTAQGPGQGQQGGPSVPAGGAGSAGGQGVPLQGDDRPGVGVKSPPGLR